MRISCLLACFCLLALLCACAAPEAALPEPPAAQVQSPEEPPAPVEPPVEPIIEEEPEPALLLSEPVWLLGRLTELYQADETQWAALADVLEAAKALNADAQLEGLETVQFQGREYIPLAEAAQRLGLEWGEAPDGLRYLARRQTVGQIPRGLERAGPHVPRRGGRDLGIFRSVCQRGRDGGAAAIFAGKRI